MPIIALLNLHFLFSGKQYDIFIQELVNSYSRINSVSHDNTHINLHVSDKNAIPQVRKFLSKFTDKQIAMLYISNRGYEIVSE